MIDLSFLKLYDAEKQMVCSRSVILSLPLPGDSQQIKRDIYIHRHRLYTSIVLGTAAYFFWGRPHIVKGNIEKMQTFTCIVAKSS